MISKNNFELARLSLTNQARDRGFVESISRKNWDTFAGWKKRGGSIKSGSRGLKVDIVVPHTDMRRGLKIVKFLTVTKTLFSINQTSLDHSDKRMTIKQ
ncbi:hypothetical protein OAC68_06940 [Gammaproteobacteria bacterium]|nr:hypothetical protein [Gammaproteobacteria bacterium]